jgi:hypothetical protein
VKNGLISCSWLHLLKVWSLLNSRGDSLDCPSTQPEIPTGVVELERQLIEVAMRACDQWGDSAQARAEMVADIKATPQRLRQNLLEHFLVAYGKAK